jgi:uncharacterized membrane protein
MTVITSNLIKFSFVNYFLELCYSESRSKLTTESKSGKINNNYVVNIILNSICMLVAYLFDNMTSVYDMWNALINVYEDNN